MMKILRTIIFICLIINLVLHNSVSASVLLQEYDISPGAGLSGLVYKTDGLIWFAANNGRSLGVLSKGGGVTFYGVPGNNQPQDIIEDKDGMIWFTAGGRIGRITEDGAIILLHQSITNDARNLTLGSDGAVWFTEFWNWQWGIGRIDTQEQVTHYQISSQRNITDIATGSDGAVWFTEYSDGTDARIGRLSLTGQYSSYSVPTYNAYPHGITPGLDGSLWFTKVGAGKIGKITIDGVVLEYNLPDGVSPSSGIVVGPDEAVWFISGSDYAIYRMATNDDDFTRYPVRNTGGGLTAITTDGKDGIWFTSSGVTQLDSYIGHIKLDIKPDAPTNLVAITPSKEAKLQWDIVTDAASYQVLRDGEIIGSTSIPNYIDILASDGRHSYSVRAVTANGISSDFSNSIELLVDNGKPNITKQFSVPANADGWHKEDVTVIFECSDGLSGIQECSEPVTVSNEGASQTVSGTAKDKAGNASNVTTVISLDKTAPVLTVPSWTSSSIQQSKTTTLSVAGSDSLSGIRDIRYTVNGGTSQTMIFDAATNTWMSSLGGKLSVGTHTITITATDHAGNVSQRTTTLKVTKASAIQTIMAAIAKAFAWFIKAIVSKIFF